MKIEAKLFTKILTQVQKMSEILGYQEVLVDRWFENDNGELEFLLVDGEGKGSFRIVLPKVMAKKFA
ncbi:hypothetical protein ACWIUA_12490 [Ursidibacter sp. B-7004-1]